MDYRELSRIAGDPAAVRSTATLVKALLGSNLNDWQDEFLSKLEKFNGPDRLTTRQCETLLLLRNRATRRSKVGKYSAFTLLTKLNELRFDLAEDDEEFFVRLLKCGSSAALTDGEWSHVFGLCRQLDLIGDTYIPLH